MIWQLVKRLKSWKKPMGTTFQRIGFIINFLLHTYRFIIWPWRFYFYFFCVLLIGKNLIKLLLGGTCLASGKPFCKNEWISNSGKRQQLAGQRTLVSIFQHPIVVMVASMKYYGFVSIVLTISTNNCECPIHSMTHDYYANIAEL